MLLVKLFLHTFLKTKYITIPFIVIMLFMLMFQICGSSFAGAMIWQYESIRSRAKKVIKSLEKQMGQIFEPAYQKEIGLRANASRVSVVLLIFIQHI